MDLEPFGNLLVSRVQSISSNSINIPLEYVLSPAYPNPFNPITNISYIIPEDGEVSLTVYDLEGRKVTILEQSLKHAGSHKVEWNASNYPSGVYFITLNTEEFNQTQKVILMK